MPDLPAGSMTPMGLPLGRGVFNTSENASPMARASSCEPGWSVTKIISERYECSPPEWTAMFMSATSTSHSLWAWATRSVR